jgi:hypothetical protein
MFKDGRTNVYDEERSGRPPVVSGDRVQIVKQKCVKDGAFRVKFRKLHAQFCRRLSQSD